MHGHRRRKKRPNYGIRTVEVNRGLHGFGFTISGQQPCILSCIVGNSPADLAGLRAGDFLISVNGLNVSKLPHEAVVQLIGNTYGAIKMAIAENYYSDSSDEDGVFGGGSVQQQRMRPKYLNHKTKFHQRTTTTKSADLVGTCEAAAGIVVNDSSPTGYNVIHSPNASNSCDISNVSAMVRSVHLDEAGPSQQQQQQPADREISLEYKAIVGYLGTIEMPKQIATSSKLQTVRSCIRKMRQEKRNPTTVLMTILPSCLNLINTSNAVIAKYSSVRLNYVSSSSESDNRYFGLVTSAIYADGLMCENSEILNQRKDVVISNSCHVFVIDSRLVDHAAHLEKADLFQILCTKDPITNLCLEFPNNSEYVVNLIRSMYNLKAPAKPESTYNKPPVARSLNLDRSYNRDLLASNSPQPSNHSEITTTSSNSDSGIGFHNDCRNISDRILVVDFPNQLNNVRAHFRKSVPFATRPVAIINELPPIRNIRSTTSNSTQIFHGKSKSADYTPFPSTSDRLTVRARPQKPETSPSKDNALNHAQLFPPPTTHTLDPTGNLVQERPVDVPALATEVFLDLQRYNADNVKNTLLLARSCDDMILSLEKEPISDDDGDDPKPLSVEDLTKPDADDHIFLAPSKPIKRSKKACSHRPDPNKLLSYKLSPKVFGLSRPLSASVENVASGPDEPGKLSKADQDHQDQRVRGRSVKRLSGGFSAIWGSLQELRSGGGSKGEGEQNEQQKGVGKKQQHQEQEYRTKQEPRKVMLPVAYSEPDLRCDEVSGSIFCLLHSITNSSMKF